MPVHPVEPRRDPAAARYEKGGPDLRMALANPAPDHAHAGQHHLHCMRDDVTRAAARGAVYADRRHPARGALVEAYREIEILGGGPGYPMVNVLMELELAQDWRRALDGDADWQGILDGFESIVDWPGSFFYRELVGAFPDAKVLLSTRDADGWARSMRETIWGVLYGDILTTQYLCGFATLTSASRMTYASRAMADYLCRDCCAGSIPRRAVHRRRSGRRLPSRRVTRRAPAQVSQSPR